jgi:hypothetical protein
MFEPLVSFNIFVKLVHAQPIKIAIPFDILQQHLPEMFFQLKVGEMEIDKMPTQIKVQNLCIVGWIVIEEK